MQPKVSDSTSILLLQAGQDPELSPETHVNLWWVILSHTASAHGWALLGLAERQLQATQLGTFEEAIQVDSKPGARSHAVVCHWGQM